MMVFMIYIFDRKENIVGKGENTGFSSIFLTEIVSTTLIISKLILSIWTCLINVSSSMNLIHSQTTNFRLLQTADDNFGFDKNGREFSKWVENTVGKGEINGYRQFLFFPQCF